MEINAYPIKWSAIGHVQKRVGSHWQKRNNHSKGVSWKMEKASQVKAG